jgi:hypothetical protein
VGISEFGKAIYCQSFLKWHRYVGMVLSGSVSKVLAFIFPQFLVLEFMVLSPLLLKNWTRLHTPDVTDSTASALQLVAPKTPAPFVAQI